MLAMDGDEIVTCLSVYKTTTGQQRKSVSVRLQKNPKSGTSLQSLCVTITCDCDPCLFYCLTVTENDFTRLRSDQGLLVDFAQFPQRLTELLQLCADQATQPSPRFSLILDTARETGAVLLDVVEANPFKHLSHISLLLREANECQLRKYLTDTVCQLKSELTEVRERLAAGENSHSTQLRQCQLQLSERNNQLNQLQEQLQQLNNSSQTQLEQKLAELRLQTQQERVSLEERHAEQLTDVRRQQMGISGELEQRLASLDKQCRQLTELKYKQELRIRELDNRLIGMDGEHSKLQQEMTSMRSHNKKLEEQGQTKSRAVQELRTRAAVLQTELKDTQHLMQRQEQQHKSTLTSKENLEQRLEELQNVLAKRESSVRIISQDLLKANDIIRKLQAESKSHHAKLKVHAQIASEQDLRLNDITRSRDQLQQQLVNTEKERSSWQLEREKLQQQLVESRQRTETAEKQLKSSEQVVSWLNKQLNQLQTADVNANLHSVPPGVSVIARSQPLPSSAVTPASYQHSTVSDVGDTSPTASRSIPAPVVATPLASSTTTAAAARADNSSTSAAAPMSAGAAEAGRKGKMDRGRNKTPLSSISPIGVAASSKVSPKSTTTTNTAAGGGSRALMAQYLHGARGGEAPSMAGLVRRSVPISR